MSKYILALDQGTTSSRSILFGRDGRAVGYGPAGVSADPAVARARRARSRGDLAIAAATGPQARSPRRRSRPPTSPRSASPTSARRPSSGRRRHGKPVANAIVWQSRISAPICERLKSRRARAAVPREDRPVARSVFLRHEDRAPARNTARPARSGPSGAKSCSARSIRSSSGG